jgi:hypothetical protein
MLFVMKLRSKIKLHGEIQLNQCLAVEKMFDVKACDAFLLLRKRGAGSSYGM